MISPRIAVLVLALVPATVAAQRGGGGRGGSRMGGQDQGSRGAAAVELKLSNGDVEDMSPIKLLIDKRKDLKLSDAQVKQFKDLESEMKTRNENLFRQLDSLRKDMSKSGDDLRNRVASDREGVQEVVANIRLSYSETLKRATERLEDTQKPTADALVQKLNDDADKTIREKLDPRGDRGFGGDAGAGRGRPPVAE